MPRFPIHPFKKVKKELSPRAPFDFLRGNFIAKHRLNPSQILSGIAIAFRYILGYNIINYKYLMNVRIKCENTDC